MGVARFEVTVVDGYPIVSFLTDTYIDKRHFRLLPKTGTLRDSYVLTARVRHSELQNLRSQLAEWLRQLDEAIAAVEANA